MIIVDTDIVIDILRGYPPSVAWLDALGDEQIVLPGYVFMELIQGCRNKQEQKRLEDKLKFYTAAWPSPKICDKALSVFSRFHLSHDIGILDALIGQLAVSLGLPLHTFNQKHYEAIPKLKMVQPYRK